MNLIKHLGEVLDVTVFETDLIWFFFWTCLKTMVCYGEFHQSLRSGNAGICPALSNPKSPVVRISKWKSKLNDSANVADSQASHSVLDHCRPDGNGLLLIMIYLSSCQISKITKASSLSTIQQSDITCQNWTMWLSMVSKGNQTQRKSSRGVFSIHCAFRHGTVRTQIYGGL